MSYLTEEQAAEKWCPEVRTIMMPARNDIAGNRASTAPGVVDHSQAMCIASGCMMWRWRVVTVEIASGEAVDNVLQRIKDGAKAEEFAPRWGSTGYCGKAGNPE